MGQWPERIGEAVAAAAPDERLLRALYQMLADLDRQAAAGKLRGTRSQYFHGWVRRARTQFGF